MTRIDDADLAKVDECPTPGCSNRVRRFPNVPIRGNGLDGEPSGPWHCDDCLRAKCRDAVARVNESRAAERERML